MRGSGSTGIFAANDKVRERSGEERREVNIVVAGVGLERPKYLGLVMREVRCGDGG